MNSEIRRYDTVTHCADHRDRVRRNTRLACPVDACARPDYTCTRVYVLRVEERETPGRPPHLRMHLHSRRMRLTLMRHKHLQTPWPDLPFIHPVTNPSRLRCAVHAQLGFFSFFSPLLFVSNNRSFHSASEKLPVVNVPAASGGNGSFRCAKGFGEFRKLV